MLFLKSLFEPNLEDAKKKIQTGKIHYFGGEKNFALELFKEALEISKKFAPEGIEAATCNHFLGRFSYDRQKYSEAEHLFRKSLKIFEGLDANWLDLALNYSYLADSCTYQGNISEGRKARQKAKDLEQHRASALDQRGYSAISTEVKIATLNEPFL